MLDRNPIPCTGRQIQKAPGIIPKNILHGSILRWKEHDSCDIETECFTVGINDQHAVADVEVAQMPKHRWVSTRAIQVPSNYCAALFAWKRTPTVPTDIIPGSLHRRSHRAVWLNSDRL